MRPIQYTFSAASTTAVCAAQTTAGAGNLILNGSLLIAQQPGIAPMVAFNPGINRPLTYTVSGADLSGRTIVATGLDASGNTVTSSRAGPNSNTVSTTELFNRVLSIHTDGALGTAMSVGSGTTGATNWYRVDDYQAPISVGLYIQITATLTAHVELTPDPFTSTSTAPHPFTHSILSTVTSDDSSEVPYWARGIRFVVDSSSGSGAAVFSLGQAGSAAA